MDKRELINTLTKIANELDNMGMLDVADRIDQLIKRAAEFEGSDFFDKKKKCVDCGKESYYLNDAMRCRDCQKAKDEKYIREVTKNMSPEELNRFMELQAKRDAKSQRDRKKLDNISEKAPMKHINPYSLPIMNYEVRS